MAQALDPALWAEIRHAWEYGPDAPSYSVAAARAAQKLGFKAPGRPAVCRRAGAEGWQRRGSMEGVAAAAHEKADALATGANAREGKKTGAAPAVRDALALQDARDEAADVRAAILDRHRREWDTVGVLVEEAHARRGADPADAFNRMKLAKITAETITLRQVGERRAWGMETIIDTSRLSEMSDAQLEALAAGKVPR
ncbi:hypothetical protein [Melaminivora suipulveris]|nr:hypothetical protein [Melaminivora suipulveris]